VFTWRKWWLLFTVIWVVVAGIQVVLILLTSEEPNRALQPAILAVGVPAPREERELTEALRQGVNRGRVSRHLGVLE